MKVSICIPVYGVEKFIRRCALCLFEQTYEDIEFVFVDDCSPDKSIAILHNTIKEFPQRAGQVIIVRHEKNIGLAGARNTAVQAATGDFILHVDPDDVITKDSVQKFVAKQAEGGYDIVSCEVEILLAGGGRKYYYQKDYSTGHELSKGILSFEVRPSVWGRLIRRSLYIDNHIKCIEGYNMAEDFQVTPLLSYYAHNVGTIHENLYIYDRTNESAMTNSFPMKNIVQNNYAYTLLNNFFMDKGTDYIDALYIGKATESIRTLITVCDADYGNDDFYKAKCDIVKSVGSKYIKSLPLPYKIVYKLLDHRKILTLFVKAMEPVNTLVKKIANGNK